MSRNHFSRVFTAAIAGASILALTACGTSGPSAGQSSGGGGGVTVWTITTSNDISAVFQKSVETYNAGAPKAKVTLTQYDPNGLKTKIQLALGAGQGPDIFFGYGGGVLDSYVKANHVYDITSALPEAKATYLPSILDAVTFNGKLYGVPMKGSSPVVMFYNNEALNKAGLSGQPKTWDDLLTSIDKLKSAGYIPISLGGQDKWPYLMFEEYLVDRVAGPGVFQKIVEGDSSAWNDLGVIQANKMIQQLVDRGAFGTSYAATGYTTGQASALVYEGKAAMQLMGTWAYGDFAGKAKDFVTSGKLGWGPFPAVTGGKGDPSDIAGNVSSFYSINAVSNNKAGAVDYLKKAVMSDSYIDGLIKGGELPPVKGVEQKLKAAGAPDFTMATYKMINDAKHYQMSWDQALPPAPAAALLDNLDALFLKKITPEQFSKNMAAAK